MEESNKFLDELQGIVMNKFRSVTNILKVLNVYHVGFMVDASELLTRYGLTGSR
jgi:hypothetical protein